MIRIFNIRSTFLTNLYFINYCVFIISFLHNNEDIFLCYLLKNLLCCLSHLGLNPSGVDFYVEYEVGIHFIFSYRYLIVPVSFPGSSDGKESTCNAGDWGSIPGSGRSPGGGHGNLLQYSCLENRHGQRSLEGYGQWGRKESDVTEQLSIAHISLSRYHLLKSHFTNSLQCHPCHKSSMRAYTGLVPGSLFCIIGVFVSGSW